MESIGARLKKAREDKGISLEQAQKDTRIHNRILAALEGGRPQEAVSGTVYIKSFIKKYADYLGLDGAALAEEYKGDKPSPSEQILIAAQKDSSFRFPVKKVIAAVVVIAVIFGCIKLVIFAGSKVKEGLKSRPKAVKKVESPRPKPVVKEAPKEAPRQAATAPAVALVPKGENISLKIKAKSDVYLKIKADGSVIYDGILKKGDAETWEAKDSLDISTSRAEAIAAELNGKALGALGKGVTKNILITRDGLKLPK
jgi:cytoskeletal protein RodZ